MFFFVPSHPSSGRAGCVSVGSVPSEIPRFYWVFFWSALACIEGKYRTKGVISGRETRTPRRVRHLNRPIISELPGLCAGPEPLGLASLPSLGLERDQKRGFRRFRRPIFRKLALNPKKTGAIGCGPIPAVSLFGPGMRIGEFPSYSQIRGNNEQHISPTSVTRKARKKARFGRVVGSFLCRVQDERHRLCPFVQKRSFFSGPVSPHMVPHGCEIRGRGDD